MGGRGGRVSWCWRAMRTHFLLLNLEQRLLFITSCWRRSVWMAQVVAILPSRSALQVSRGDRSATSGKNSSLVSSYDSHGLMEGVVNQSGMGRMSPSA